MKVIFLFFLLPAIVAHPLCGLSSDNFYSPTAQSASFCSAYANSSCCDVFKDSVVRQLFLNSNVSAQCEPYHKQFLCTLCDPYQAHLYNLESNNAALDEPYLCNDFCAEYAQNCPELAVNCTALVGPSPYCYPINIPSSGAGGLDIVFETSLGVTIDYFDLSASYPDEFYSTFDGKVLAVNKNNGQERVLFTIPGVFNQGELGFLTFELHPDFESNGVLFVFYSVQEPEIDGGGKTRMNYISRVTLGNGNNEPEFCPLFIVQKQSWNHNGGDFEWDDDNVTLYFSIGDAAPQNGNGNAQDLTTVWGSVIAFIPNITDPCDYTIRNPLLPENLKRTATNNYIIPEDNPFVGVPGVREEIYAHGFRNPWRLSKHNGVIYIGDVGQQRFEETDILVKGKNYGWELTEGFSCFVNDIDLCNTMLNNPDYQPPVFDYAHFAADIPPTEIIFGFSITLGHIYTGSIRPDLVGKFIFCDYIMQQCWAVVPTPNGSAWSGAELIVDGSGGVISIRKDSSGESIFITFSGAYVLRDLDVSPTPIYKNGICEVGENCRNSPDCPGKLKGPRDEKFCCADGICAEGNCTVNCGIRAMDVGCGNRYCEPGETCDNCPYDCQGHDSNGNGGAHYCCVGQEDFTVLCVEDVPGSGDCSDDPCTTGKNGPKNDKFSTI